MFRHLLIVACLVAFDVDSASIQRFIHKATDACTSQIYCHGRLLKTIQLNEIYEDSKGFVDLAQLNDPDVTLKNFDDMMARTNDTPNRNDLTEFILENFEDVEGLEDWIPTDWQEQPLILRRIQDPKFQGWVYKLNGLWKTLSKKIKKSVLKYQDRHSLIYLENGFIIPGGRFKELYYWDSYWIMKGLLLSGMSVTVKGMLENLLSMVNTYGFVPNGGRVYYLTRSQPPLLISMVNMYVEFTKDLQFLTKNIATLEEEFAYWQREKTVKVEKDGKTYKMAHYFVNSEGPRPESYKEDYMLGLAVQDEEQRNDLYNDIKAAAESGWDFSSRWFISKDGTRGNLSDVATKYIIPVDLNSFIQQNARLLGKFHLKLRNLRKAKHYRTVAQEYQNGIDNVLWNEKAGAWFDYDNKNKKSRPDFYPSNVTPLYTKSYDLGKARTYAERVVDYLKKNQVLEYMGGTPTSSDFTGEQWDFPNAWPPLQSILVVGLHETGWQPATDLAKELATRWLRANYVGFATYQEMFEKYDSLKPGEYGGGGEYIVQEGFGWTNGVALELLDMYPSTTSSDQEIIVKCNDCIDR